MRTRATIWRGDLPDHSYQEGLDAMLGRYCAFSFPDRIEIHHFERGHAAGSSLSEAARFFAQPERTSS